MSKRLIGNILLKVAACGAAILLIGASAMADTSKKVSGRSFYYVPRNVSRAEAENIALERARVDALHKGFGTSVSLQTQSSVRSDSKRDDSSYWEEAATLTRGEWVMDTREPQYGIYLDDDEIVVTCEVEGLAREIRKSTVDLRVSPLRKGNMGMEESSIFVDGEHLFVRIQASVEGYVAIYLKAEDEYVARLLPCSEDKAPSCKIEGNKENVFFVSDDGRDCRYTLNTDKAVEHDMLYVVYSPNKLIRPVDSRGEARYGGGLDTAVDEMTVKDFNKWIAHLKKVDEDLQLVSLPVTITSGKE